MAASLSIGQQMGMPCALHQLCPQTGTWKVPETCEEPILEGAPYHYGHLVSLGHGAMPALSPVLPLLARLPVDLVLVEALA